MKKGKLTDKMNFTEVIITMTEFNPGAYSVILGMLGNLGGFRNIKLCDSLDIRGERLYRLFTDCCNNNFGKFNRTLQMLKNGVFSEEEIQLNFKLDFALPFIDDEITADGYLPYENHFCSDDPKWEEYCKKNKELFKIRLKEKLKEQKSLENEIERRNAERANF